MKRPIVGAALSWGAGLVLSGAQAGRMLNQTTTVLITLVYVRMVIHIVRKRKGSSMWYVLLPLFFLLGVLCAQKRGRELYGAQDALVKAGVIETARTLDETMPVIAGQEQATRISGRVLMKSKRENEEGTEYVYTLENVWVNDIALSGKALLYSAREAAVGSRIRAKGEIGVFASAKNPGGFEAFTHYGYRGIYYHVYEGEIVAEEKSDDAADVGREMLLRLRERWLEMINRMAPEDVSGFFCGILLGEKNEMEEEEKESLRRSGLAHILTISGLHISMLGTLLLAFLKRIRIPFRARYVCGICLIGGYVYLTGAGSPSLRAYEMFVLMSIARIRGRTYDGKCALAFCFMFQTLQEPLLIFDAGFQLSFMSMFAILFFVPRVQMLWIRKKGEEKLFCSKIRASLLTSWTVLVVISPVICASYYETARYAMFLNLLILPLLSVMLLSLMLGIVLFSVLSGIGLWMGRITILPAVCLARMILKLSAFSEALPGNVCVTGKPQPAELFMYLVVYGGGLVLLCLASRLETFGRRKSKKVGKAYRPDKRRYRIALFGMLMVSGLLIPNALKRRPPADAELVMLDVGQGDGFIFRFPDGENLLIDGGNAFRDDLWARVLEPALLYYGIDTIDAWLLTHYDMDHISGFVQMQKERAKEKLRYEQARGRVACLRVLISREETPERLADLCGNMPDETIHALTAGSTFTIGGAVAVCLLPDPDFPVVTENDASVVLRMEYKMHSLLLCADMSEEQERYLLKKKATVSADVLKVAHHGSIHSTCDAFAEAVAPKVALISVGKNNYGHPAPEVLSRLKILGADIQMTDSNGAVFICLRKNGEISISRKR